MDLTKLRKLSIEEQIEELRKLKEEFNSEKEDLKNQINELEAYKNKKIKHIQDIGSKKGLITAVEVKDITSEIRSTRDLLDSKNKELSLLQKAIENAEKILEQSQEDLAVEKEHELHLAFLRELQRFHIHEEQKKAKRVEHQVETLEDEAFGNEEDISDLEDEIKNTEIKEEIKNAGAEYSAGPQYEPDKFSKEYGKSEFKQENIYTPSTQQKEEPRYEPSFKKPEPEKEEEDELGKIKKYD